MLAIVREAEYRVNFLVGILEGFAQLGVALLIVALLYSYTPSVAGWSAPQALLLVGIYRIADSLIALQIAPNLFRVGEYVSRGDLDFYLLRPVSSQFLVSLRWLQPAEAVNALIGLVMVVAVAPRAGVHWSALGVLAALLFALSGLIVLYALWFACVTLSIWLVRLGTLANVFYAAWEPAKYPISYFKGFARAVLTFVIPIAFATSLPTRALLGDADPRLLAVGIALAAVALFLSHRFWNFALRHYASASS